MPTTVRVNAATRRRLEEIRARLSLAAGRKVTLEETLDRITADPELADRLVGRLQDEAPRLDDAAWGRVLDLPSSYGTTVPPDAIDDVIAEEAAGTNGAGQADGADGTAGGGGTEGGGGAEGAP